MQKLLRIGRRARGEDQGSKSSGRAAENDPRRPQKPQNVRSADVGTIGIALAGREGEEK